MTTTSSISPTGSSSSSSSISPSLHYPYLQCSCTRYSSIVDLYFCNNCHQLKCTHPLCTTEVIDHGICQRCLRLTNYKDMIQNHGW